jgi:hypothetical protein
MEKRRGALASRRDAKPRGFSPVFSSDRRDPPNSCRPRRAEHRSTKNLSSHWVCRRPRVQELEIRYDRVYEPYGHRRPKSHGGARERRLPPGDSGGGGERRAQAHADPPAPQLPSRPQPHRPRGELGATAENVSEHGAILGAIEQHDAEGCAGEDGAPCEERRTARRAPRGAARTAELSPAPTAHRVVVSPS